MSHLRLPAAAALVAALLSLPLRAEAQPAAAPTAAPAAGALAAATPPITLDQILARLPPPPPVLPLPPGASPPAVVTGVLSIPDIMRFAVASQQVDKEIGARRQKLAEDEQKEQQSLRDLNQQLANERAKLSPDQARARDREMQDRFNESRRRFALRDRIIQDAAQFCLVQMQRTMTAVVQQVAAAHNMNFVLRREQVVMNTADVDITAQVIAELNQLLPAVIIPPDGVAVLDLKPVAEATASKPAPAPAAPQKH